MLGSADSRPNLPTRPTSSLDFPPGSRAPEHKHRETDGKIAGSKAIFFLFSSSFEFEVLKGTVAGLRAVTTTRPRGVFDTLDEPRLCWWRVTATAGTLHSAVSSLIQTTARCVIFSRTSAVFRTPTAVAAREEGVVSVLALGRYERAGPSLLWLSTMRKRAKRRFRPRRPLCGASTFEMN